MLATLPSQHARYHLFVDHEGASLAALGFASQAVTRYRRLVDIFTQRAQVEPDRADYQRDLSISHQRLGICFAELDHSDEAAASLERHLQLALDVYQRFPGQVDVVVDLATALHLTAASDDDGDNRNQQSRDLLEVLEADQRLPSHGKALLDYLRQDRDLSPRRKT